MKKLRIFISFLYTFLIIQGCTTYKNIPYFQDLPDSARANILNAPYRELTIQTDDIVNVYIQTIDPTANIIFNQSVGMNVPQSNANVPVSSAGNQTSIINNYLVDKAGYIELPMLGKIKLSGLTTAAARDTIQSKAALYYKMPTVNVRFANLKITVLGEVLRPGTFILPNEKNTIFDALGLSGDLTVFGKRENALLIRDSSGNSKLIRFNLNSKDLVKEDFFFLKQNDVIYIEPNKAKIASLDAIKTRNYTIIASLLTVLIVFLTRK